MIRRITASTAAALALVVVPVAAASAYEAEGFRATVSDSTITVGETITYSVDGPTVNRQISATLTSNPASVPNSAIEIAGTATLTEATNATGDAVFSITLSSPGVYTITGTDAESDVFNTQTIQVVPAGSAGATTGRGVNASGDRGMFAFLPVTGSSAVVPLALGAGALAAAGVGVLVYTRKRRGGLDV